MKIFIADTRDVKETLGNEWILLEKEEKENLKLSKKFPFNPTFYKKYGEPSWIIDGYFNNVRLYFLDIFIDEFYRLVDKIVSLINSTKLTIREIIKHEDIKKQFTIFKLERISGR